MDHLWQTQWHPVINTQGPSTTQYNITFLTHPCHQTYFDLQSDGLFGILQAALQRAAESWTVHHLLKTLHSHQLVVCYLFPEYWMPESGPNN